MQGKVIAKPETSDIAGGLNQAGQVTVTSSAGSFLTDGKTVQPAPPSPFTLTIPGGTWTGSVSSEATGATGQVVGNYYNSQGWGHAVSINNGKITELGTLGGASSQATAANASGQVVGSSQITPSNPLSPYSSPSHAFLYSGGAMKDLQAGRDDQPGERDQCERDGGRSFGPGSIQLV